MNAEIITIGDELLIGQVNDTNSSFIAKELLKIGCSIVHKESVPDLSIAIYKAIDEGLKRADLLILTGGLGATPDDLTLDVLCDYFDTQLVENLDILARIEQIAIQKKFPFNALSRSQCRVPKAAQIIPNEIGTAPITWFEKEGKIVISLPGVPMETEYAVTHHIIPKLVKVNGENQLILHRTILLYGTAENALSQELSNWEKALPQEYALSYLPSWGYLRLRLNYKGENSEKATHQFETLYQQLCTRTQPYLMAEGEEEPAALLGKWLGEKGESISTAESCTGGNIAKEITTYAGSSAYFTGSVIAYQNEIKSHILGVSETDLNTEGAVSQPVVEQMAKGVQQLMNTTCSIATSGIAGPGGGSVEKPVGTVWISVRYKDKMITQKYTFSNNRAYNISKTTNQALLLLLSLIKKEHLKIANK